MIINRNFEELMVDMETGERFLRPLEKEEVMEFVINNPSDFEEVNVMYIKKLNQLGFSLEEIAERLLCVES
jgi:hypothetical protein